MATSPAGAPDDSRAFWTTLALGAVVPFLAVALADWFEIDLASELGLRVDTALLGVAATAPPFAFLCWIMRSRAQTLVAFREAQIEFFRTIGFSFTPSRILLLSLAAGIGEELLFRGVFQLVGERHLPIIAAIIAPNLLFGALHARSLIYAVAAAIVGTYLGLTFWLSGSLAVAIIAHALYDLLALEWTRRILNRIAKAWLRKVKLPPKPARISQRLRSHDAARQGRVDVQARLVGVLIGLGLCVACSGGDPAPAPAPANRAPVFTSAASVTVAENAGAAFYTAVASDADGDAVTFTISGGADAARFSIGAGGALSFVAPPDFEGPADANGDNIYLVTLRASDGALAATLDLTVTVTDVANEISVRRIAVGLNQPLFLLSRGDGSNRVFVLEKGGQIEILDPATGLLNPTPFLDISTSISTNGERGLLGMALAPEFATSGDFYLNVTNLAGDTEIRRYRRSTTNPDFADAASLDVILTAAQPADNHNGGWLGFGPDGFLYVALGDGGGSNDPFGNGQNLNTLLGKILRIDPSTDAFPADPLRDYAIPAGNPFAGGGGRPEIFAYGLRNPFRASFDRQTGDLYIGDVGQSAIEELDLIRPNEGGLNFGWPILEGTRVNQAGSTAGMTPPIAEYGHGSGPTQGDSITGGYVYRGPVAALQGAYIFGDFISDNIWSFPASAAAQGATIAASSFTLRNSDFAPDIGVIDSISSFGEDANGDFYLIGIDGEIYRIAN